MRLFSEAVSEALTRNIYKFKVTFREPQQGALYLSKHEKHNLHLLEDKTKQ
jgi:heat-inducible transcriptional repressor